MRNSLGLLLFALTLMGFPCFAQTTLPTVVIVGTFEDFGDMACASSDCLNAASELEIQARMEWQMMYNEILQEGDWVPVNREQFCQALADAQPSGCDFSNPPSVPGFDLNWAPNGCGDSSIQSDLVNALWAVVGSRVGATGLNHPASGIEFSTACNAHDRCYGLSSGKTYCDQAFLSDMLSICASSWNPACGEIAQGYYDAVDTFGQNAYDSSAVSFTCAAWSSDMERNECA